MDADRFDTLISLLGTAPTRRVTLRALLSLSLVALFGGDIAGAKSKGKGGGNGKGKGKGKSKGKGKKKQGPPPIPNYWSGVWTTSHGTDNIPAGTMYLTQTGANIAGELVDPEGAHLPLTAFINGSDFKSATGTMRSAFSNNISIELILNPDLVSFRGGYYILGATPYTPWTGVKQ
jgi:hypothetical protein